MRMRGVEDINARALNWCWTLNNWEELDVEYLKSLSIHPDVKYICWGKEVGKEGTPHLQGCLCLAVRKRFLQTKKILGSKRFHLEKMEGTPLQASDYCKKDEDYLEFGTLPEGAGHRSDLVSLKNDIDSGKRLRDIADDHFATFLRYNRGIQLYYSLKARARNWETLVIVYYGNTGTGKTFAVHDNSTDLYVHPGGQWFDGYYGHKQVLFDDFGGSEFKLTYLLKLLDRYPMQVPIKGGFVNWCPHEIYITSNMEPDSWYSNALEEHVNALKRRFSFTFKFE